MLQGKKTYIVATVMALYAIVVVGFHGGDIEAAGRLIMEAAALAGLRNGIG